MTMLKPWWWDKYTVTNKNGFGLRNDAPERVKKAWKELEEIENSELRGWANKADKIK